MIPQAYYDNLKVNQDEAMKALNASIAQRNREAVIRDAGEIQAALHEWKARHQGNMNVGVV